MKISKIGCVINCPKSQKMFIIHKTKADKEFNYFLEIQENQQ